MNYQTMRDNELNMMVADLRGGYAGDVHGSESMVKVKDPESCGLFYVEVDYCNNPSDAMPILIEMKIGFKWVNGSCTASSVMRGYHESTSDNPLRAAMIVFLMMQESKS